VIELKRKPDQVIVHRIEMQQKERELIEQAMMVNGATSIIKSIASMDIKTMYALLTILEGFGLIDTKIPTIGDGSVEDAINTWAENSKTSRSEKIFRQASGINWMEALFNIEVPSVGDFRNPQK
jgi:hypothetical protein